ncbi:LysE family translocator [Marinomonas sp. 2405UD68-3]|uniref:LysE family translocator n=1 Tax=Marinomonas sp. 2405UD68-3 TaxID=3391835 RepID=UPI0039C8F380
MFSAALIYILAVMSPGPNFILVSRGSVSNSVSSGIGSTVGICLVGLLFSISCVSGLALLLDRFPIVGLVATILGAIYLLYIAYSLLKSKPEDSIDENKNNSQELNFIASIKAGIFTNIGNMKTIAFMISIFSGFLSVPRGLDEKILVILLCSSLEFLWYALVSIAFGQKVFKVIYVKYSKEIDKILGVFLIFFATNNIYQLI